MPERWRSGAGGPRGLTLCAGTAGRCARRRWAMGTPAAWIIDHDPRGRQADLTARRWLGPAPAAGLRPALPGPVSVTGREVQAQAVRGLAAGLDGGRMLRRVAAMTRVWVREVAATIGGQPQEGASGSVRSVESCADHPWP